MTYFQLLEQQLSRKIFFEELQRIWQLYNFARSRMKNLICRLNFINAFYPLYILFLCDIYFENGHSGKMPDSLDFILIFSSHSKGNFVNRFFINFGVRFLGCISPTHMHLLFKLTQENVKNDEKPIDEVRSAV